MRSGWPQLGGKGSAAGPVCRPARPPELLRGRGVRHERGDQLRRVRVLTRRYVAVGVHRDGDVRVAQPGLDDLRVDVRLQCEAWVAVPKVVESHPIAALRSGGPRAVRVRVSPPAYDFQ